MNPFIWVLFLPNTAIAINIFYNYTVNFGHDDSNQVFDNQDRIIVSRSAKSLIVTETIITVLSKDILQIQAPIELVIMFACNIEKIEPGLFDSLQIHEELLISDNSLYVLHRGTFKNLPTKRLVLLRNRLVSIESGAFENLTLEMLDLEGNNLASLEAEWFVDVRRVNELRVAGNRLVVAADPLGIFAGNVSEMIFADNKIERFVCVVLAGSSAIRKLDLDHNSIESLSFEEWNGTVEYLSLRFNFLTTVPANLPVTGQLDVWMNLVTGAKLNELRAWARKNSVVLDYRNGGDNVQNDRNLILVALLCAVLVGFSE